MRFFITLFFLLGGLPAIAQSKLVIAQENGLYGLLNTQTYEWVVPCQYQELREAHQKGDSFLGSNYFNSEELANSANKELIELTNK